MSLGRECYNLGLGRSPNSTVGRTTAIDQVITERDGLLVVCWLGFSEEVIVVRSNLESDGMNTGEEGQAVLESARETCPASEVRPCPSSGGYGAVLAAAARSCPETTFCDGDRLSSSEVDRRG